MGSGENWTKEETSKALNKKARDVLAEVKKRNEKKKFKYVKVSDHPLTYKEIEIKDEKNV